MIRVVRGFHCWRWHVAHLVRKGQDNRTGDEGRSEGGPKCLTKTRKEELPGPPPLGRGGERGREEVEFGDNGDLCVGV